MFGVALVLVVPIVVSLYEPDTTQDKSSQISSKETSRKDFLIIFGIYILTFLAMVLLFMVPSQIPFFLVDIDVLSPFEAGLAVGLFSLSGGISSLIFPWLHKVQIVNVSLTLALLQEKYFFLYSHFLLPLLLVFPQAPSHKVLILIF